MIYFFTLYFSPFIIFLSSSYVLRFNSYRIFLPFPFRSLIYYSKKKKRREETKENMKRAIEIHDKDIKEEENEKSYKFEAKR